MVQSSADLLITRSFLGIHGGIRLRNSLSKSKHQVYRPDRTPIRECSLKYNTKTSRSLLKRLSLFFFFHHLHLLLRTINSFLYISRPASSTDSKTLSTKPHNLEYASQHPCRSSRGHRALGLLSSDQYITPAQSPYPESLFEVRIRSPIAELPISTLC